MKLPRIINLLHLVDSGKPSHDVEREVLGQMVRAKLLRISDQLVIIQCHNRLRMGERDQQKECDEISHTRKLIWHVYGTYAV